MKTRFLPRGLRCLLVTLVVSIVAAPAGWAATAFSKIVVFGDSLNDRGNMVQFTGGVFPNAPTYTYGRQSNGPVWVEYFAARLAMADLVVNYAVVGAMTKATPTVPTGNVWSGTFPGLEGTDVTTQVSDYLGDVQGVADPDALYILEGGANDFTRVPNPAVIISNLIGSLMTLEASGARHIVLVNLPDLGKTPRVILGERMGLLPPGTAPFLSAVSNQLNQALVSAATAVTPAGVSVTIADIHGFMNSVTADPAKYGLGEVQMPWLLAGAGTNPATWLFWDDLHPTTRGHQIFAEHALDELLDTYSPSQGNGKGQGAINGLRGLVR